MPRGRTQIIQDSVHGLMEFHGMETVVIDILRTPEIQRLRKIRQTGLAHLVFPGSEHSRLSHCLGASHLAIRFIKHLKESTKDYLIDILRPNEASIRDLAVAALCHDLGHGPLSHAWEREVVGEQFDRNSWIKSLGLSDCAEEVKDFKWHELVGQSFLAWDDGQLHKLLEQHDRGFSKRLRFLLAGKYYLQYLPLLLSSDIDVDRADFLRRDSHQTGVTYGWYDLDRLLTTCNVGKNTHNKLVIGFDEKKACRVVEQFLIARRALYENIYYHKTVRSAEGMVGLFLKRLKEVIQVDQGIIRSNDLIEPLIKVMSGGVVGPQQLLLLDDFSLWVLIEHVSRKTDMDITVKDLAQRIVYRDLFKNVPCESKKIEDFLRQDKGREKLYRAIQPFCPGKPEFYLIADTIDLEFFSKDISKTTFFIDEKYNAQPVKDHPDFRIYLEPKSRTRLFTINEAVEAVKKLIG